MFKVPPFASQPSLTASLQVLEGDRIVEEVEVDRKPFYLFGTTQDCDFRPSAAELAPPRHFAALVHHKDSRLFLISLTAEQRVYTDRRDVPINKPVHLKSGVNIAFEGWHRSFHLVCETAGIKRNAEEMSSKSGTVRASHILVKHRDSRRPSSWKEQNVTRSKEEALRMIKHFREQILSGQVSFEDLAARESHCNSARRGGDLGDFGPGQMQAAFEKATYALQVGEISEPIFTDSGVHLIKRTA